MDSIASYLHYSRNAGNAPGPPTEKLPRSFLSPYAARAPGPWHPTSACPILSQLFRYTNSNTTFAAAAAAFFSAPAAAAAAAAASCAGASTSLGASRNLREAPLPLATMPHLPRCRVASFLYSKPSASTTMRFRASPKKHDGLDGSQLPGSIGGGSSRGAGP